MGPSEPLGLQDKAPEERSIWRLGIKCQQVALANALLLLTQGTFSVDDARLDKVLECPHEKSLIGSHVSFGRVTSVAVPSPLSMQSEPAWR